MRKQDMPKVSRRKIGSKPVVQNIWRQMCRQAASEVKAKEDADFLKFMDEELAKVARACSVSSEMIQGSEASARSIERFLLIRGDKTKQMREVDRMFGKFATDLRERVGKVAVRQLKA